MKKKLILVGGGGHCKAVIDVAENAGYSILGILDTPDKIGMKVLSSNIIGDDDDIKKYIKEALFLITVGFIKDNTLRINLFNKIKNDGGEFATIISPTAYISKYAKIGEGSIVMHGATINAEVNVGNNCIINTLSNIEHEVNVGNNTHISTGVMINGGCNIGMNVFIGSQSTISQSIQITDNCIIGSNSFVNRDLTHEGTYVGTPIKQMI